jgi:hypothetical protein
MMFARKFNDGDAALLQRLDAELSAVDPANVSQ